MLEDNAFRQIARRLANPQTKAVRDRGVRVLKKWLLSRGSNLDGRQCRRIWHALFYCFWYADKVAIQLELAENLASLVHSIGNADAALEFLSAFWACMQREWAGLDSYRLNKYLDLVRRVVRQTIVYSSQQGFDESSLGLVTASLRAGPLASSSGASAARGLSMHVCDVFIDELVSVLSAGAAGEAGGAPSGEQGHRQQIAFAALVTLCGPFLDAMQLSLDVKLVSKIQSEVIDGLLIHADVLGLLPELRHLASILHDRAFAKETITQNRKPLLRAETTVAAAGDRVAELAPLEPAAPPVEEGQQHEDLPALPSVSSSPPARPSSKPSPAPAARQQAPCRPAPAAAASPVAAAARAPSSAGRSSSANAPTGRASSVKSSGRRSSVQFGRKNDVKHFNRHDLVSPTAQAVSERPRKSALKNPHDLSAVRNPTETTFSVTYDEQPSMSSRTVREIQRQLGAGPPPSQQEQQQHQQRQSKHRRKRSRSNSSPGSGGRNRNVKRRK